MRSTQDRLRLDPFGVGQAPVRTPRETRPAMPAVLQPQPVHLNSLRIDHSKVRSSRFAPLSVGVAGDQVLGEIRRGAVARRARRVRREITAPAHERSPFPCLIEDGAVEMNRCASLDTQLRARLRVVEVPRDDRLVLDLGSFRGSSIRVAAERERVRIDVPQDYRAGAGRPVCCTRRAQRGRAETVAAISYRSPQHRPGQPRYLCQFRVRRSALTVRLVRALVHR